MKKILLFTLILCGLTSFAGPKEIVLNDPSHQHDHIEFFPTADMPEAVYYDDDTDEITIVADGFSSYYNVVIIRDIPYQTVISTQVSGYGDTIDVSSLSSGNYTIIITSEYNNVFEGHFTII